MGLIYQAVNFSDLRAHRDLRLGLSIASFKDVITTFKLNNKYPLIRLNKVLSLEYGSALVEQDRNEDGEYPVMGSNGVVGYHDEFLIEGPSIIVGRKGSAGEVTYITENNFPIDTTFYVKTKVDTYRLKFLYYLLRVAKLSRLALFKGVPGLNRFDVYEILIPVIPKAIQDKLLAEVEPLEEQIVKLQEQLKQPLEVINSIFANEFKYSSTLWKEYGKGMTAGTQKSNVKSRSFFNVPLGQLYRSGMIRFSSRFHNPFTQKLMNILSEQPAIKVAHIITENIKRGVQPRADIEGDICAIKTAQLKNNYIDLENCEKVSFDFYERNIKAQLKLGDILMSSTGKVSLGKVDLIDFEDDAIVDGHVSIIRIDETKYNKLFFVYFFRSILGSFQIERDFTGATNQIELYADQIEDFLIPDISLKKQEIIVENVKNELEFQKQIMIQIDKKQSEISKIIGAAIKNKD